MKKIITFVLLISAISLQAQDFKNPKEEKVSFSVKAGWLNSTLKGKDLNHISSSGKVNDMNDFFVGLSVDNPIGKAFSLKHEVFYQNQGASFPRELNGSSLDARSEEHTSELQSRFDLVCRLLLEK